MSPSQGGPTYNLAFTGQAYLKVMVIYMYSPGAGVDTWCQYLFKNINLLSIWSFVASFSLKGICKFFSFKHIGDQIYPCRKLGQGQPKVIIYTNFEELELSMQHTRFQDHKTGEENFYGFNHIWAWCIAPWLG